jgi:uncharacterized protein (DUF433 family)
MKRNRLLERISIAPAMLRQTLYQGDRIWVSLVLDLLSAGLSIEEILEEYQ